MAVCSPSITRCSIGWQREPGSVSIERKRIISYTSHKRNNHESNGAHQDPGKENSASNDSQIWKEAAFPQYLQESVESSNFCDLWEDAKKRHTTLKGQEMHVKDTTLWRSIRREAEKDARDEPLLSSFLYASILSHDSFARSLSFILANRLSNATMLPTELFELFHTILSKHHKIREHAQADLCAMRERDPACRSYSQALLYFKGYHAIQVQRMAHSLWHEGRKVMALALQSRSSEVFAVDIHPAAEIGKGVLLDHGTGVVIGETARIGNNVSILQNVTLGGTGKEHGDRHPKVSDNVLIGASATILGNITIGKGAQVAAGSLVLKPVPPKTMVAGSPAKEVGKVYGNPALNMEQWHVKQSADARANGHPSNPSPPLLSEDEANNSFGVFKVPAETHPDYASNAPGFETDKNHANDKGHSKKKKKVRLSAERPSAANMKKKEATEYSVGQDPKPGQGSSPQSGDATEYYI